RVSGGSSDQPRARRPPDRSTQSLARALPASGEGRCDRERVERIRVHRRTHARRGAAEGVDAQAHGRVTGYRRDVGIAPATHMGLVGLRVADLGRTLDFWQLSIGLQVLERGDGAATLGTDTPLLRVVAERGAQPDRGHTGLYHVALLVPDRPSLARWL